MTNKELTQSIKKCKDRSDKNKKEKFLEDVTCTLCGLSCLRVIESGQCDKINKLF